MKILAFAACVTVAVAMGSTFDRDTELQKFRKSYYECCEKISCVENKYPPEVIYCTMKKYDSSMFNEEDWVLWEKVKQFMEQIIDDPDKQKESVRIVGKCLKKAHKRIENEREEFMEAAHCARDVMKLIIEDI